MSDGLAISLSVSFLGVCGIVVAALLTRSHKNGNSTKDFVRREMCETVQNATLGRYTDMVKSLDALWVEFRSMDAKMDKVIAQLQIEL